MLAPWADLVNHDVDRACYFDWDGSALVLRPDRSYAPGEQVFASYGQKSSGQLLLSYGFVPETNPHEAVRVELTVDPDSPAAAALQRYAWSVCSIVGHVVNISRCVAMCPTIALCVDCACVSNHCIVCWPLLYIFDRC